MLEVCEVISRRMVFRNKATGETRQLTPREIFEYSPTGELANVFVWYEQCRNWPEMPAKEEGKQLGPQLHISPYSELKTAVVPVKNTRFVKPEPGSGLWTSTYRDGGSAWVDAAEEMGFSPRSVNWFVLEPDPNARVLVMRTLADLRRLLRDFAAPPLWPGSNMMWPDFERISDNWDAIHLTEAGQWKTRLTIPSLYGWDSESTLWFRWRFTSCRRVEVTPPPEAPDRACPDSIDAGNATRHAK